MAAISEEKKHDQEISYWITVKREKLDRQGKWIEMKIDPTIWRHDTRTKTITWKSTVSGRKGTFSFAIGDGRRARDPAIPGSYLTKEIAAGRMVITRFNTSSRYDDQLSTVTHCIPYIMEGEF